MSMGNVRGGQISAGDKKKIADLKRKAKQTAVYRGGKRLNQSELDSRKADLQRQIANIQTRGGSEAYSYRPRFFGRPTRDIRTPSVTDTNINELLRANVGQPGGVRAEPASFPKPRPPRSSTVSSVNDTNINDLMVRNLGQQGGFPQPITAQPGMSFEFARNPQRDSSRISSVYAQDYARQDPLRSVTGSVQSNINLLPPNMRSQFINNRGASLMETLERDTGGFPSALPRPTVEPVTDTNINDILVSNLGQQGGLPPMITDGRSFSRPYGTQRGISLGTVGGFGRGLFDELASSGAGYFPQPQPDVQLTIGDLPVNPGMFGVDKNAIDRVLLNTAINSYMKRPLVGGKEETRLPNVNVTSSPYMTPSPSLENISVRPRGVGTDIYGNPRIYTGQELESMYRPTIRGLLRDKQYTLY